MYSNQILGCTLILTSPASCLGKNDMDYFSMISFHTPSSSGFSTIDIFSMGFAGARITMSSNSPHLNLKGLRFSVNQSWLNIENHIEGRVTITMTRMPTINESHVIMGIKNLRNGYIYYREFKLETWLTGDGAKGDSLAGAKERCNKYGGRLLKKSEFKKLTHNWFGLSYGTVKEKCPSSYIFDESFLLSEGIWIKEGKSLHLNTGQKYDGKEITTLCRYEYPAINHE
ncbi:hypothetical protein [Enterobacter huaxiensis]|uniref:hypothetical protein n=1 Tax=Enterobacter huaxiensis TaxID=2494702 RepID=UPI0021D80AB4|nr:hypothetical protein [Enterobacter huaxiensis]